ncbi:MAG: PspA/IM30 family protein [Rhizobiaceae bacterium]
MFKSLFALIRGHSNEAAQSVVDRNAMVILRQQIRDCGDAVTTARKAVAITVAQNKQELEQYKQLMNRIQDLEKRTVSAIEQGKDELAKEGAETIAILEAERETSLKAQSAFEAEIQRLNTVVRQSEARLRDLQRGHRLADATDKTQRLRQSAPNSGLSALQDAENTLERLRTRQKQIDATAAAMDEMALNNDPSTISQKMAEAGCGTPLKSSADEILDRLTKKSRSKTKSTA